jgi:DNA transformation protein
VHCLELLAPLGAVRAKRMFGGHGVYLDDLMFALVASEQLYMKVDAQTLAQWQAAGGRPFVYETRRAAEPRRSSMSYWTPPEEAMESPGLMQPWARLALAAALRARAAKKTKVG